LEFANIAEYTGVNWVIVKPAATILRSQTAQIQIRPKIVVAVVVAAWAAAAAGSISIAGLVVQWLVRRTCDHVQVASLTPGRPLLG